MRISDISRVYVVNLERRTDRWESIQKSWKETGVDIPLTRFIACDGRVFKPPKSWDVGNGAYGCYLSHISIMVEAARTGLEHFLVLEDDAVFADDFKAVLESCLADLPSDYDQCYLGWQALFSGRIPPIRLTEHLCRAGNNNRNHGALYSLNGAIRFLPRLTELSERGTKHHLDHWMGQLHEELTDEGTHAYNVYASVPQIVYQGAGTSDICGKKTPLNTWLYEGPWGKEYADLVTVKSYKTVFGKLGRHGRLGYEGRKTNTKETEHLMVLSLHAPSEMIVTCDTALNIKGVMNSTGKPQIPVDAVIDGKKLGSLAGPGEMTSKGRLEPGEHKLGFVVDPKKNAYAHTYWAIYK